jgi:hypothetical protein
MTDIAIQQMVCRAVVSDQYRLKLLGADRAEVLRASGLDAREQEALLEIQAETIEDFAASVERALRHWRRSALRRTPVESVPDRGMVAVEIPRRRR